MLNLTFEKIIHSMLNSRMYTYHYDPANIYLFKINNRNIRKNCKICSKLIIKKRERRYWRCSDVSIVDFEQENVSWGHNPRG